MLTRHINFPLAIVIIVSISLFIGNFLKTEAQAIPLIDFGGRIALYQPVCFSPLTGFTPSAVLINIAIPKPTQIMYMTGASISQSFGPPTHPGQILLGKPAPAIVPCLIPCPLGLCPHPQGGGLPILYHGSSAV